MKGGVIGCLINQECMVCSPCISGDEGSDGMGPVSHRSAFPSVQTLKSALDFVVPGELAEEVLSIPCWVGEKLALKR